MWLKDASGLHRLDAVTSVTPDNGKPPLAVLHINGVIHSTATPYADVVAMLNPPQSATGGGGSGATV